MEGSICKEPILIFLIGFFISCQQLDTKSKEPRIPDISIKVNDIRFHKNNGVLFLDSVPYSGYTVIINDSNRILEKTGHFQGKKHGPDLAYFETGKLMQKRVYVNGLRHGEHLGYYKNGLLKFQYFFENGMSQGTHRMWYEDGKLMSEMNYVDGRERGRQRVWRSDGKLRSNYITRENGRQYGMLGIQRCTKIDSKSGNIDPFKREKR